MKKSHSYNFEGGEYLTKMGATWFVSYAYCEKIDAGHTNWNNISDSATRKSVYKKFRTYHKLWLEKIFEMNDNRLKTNRIGLNPAETKRMAEIVLETMNGEP